MLKFQFAGEAVIHASRDFVHSLLQVLVKFKVK